MIKAVYAGSFDPVTNGHLDIIIRAAKLFGALTVLVMRNGDKQPIFSLSERVTMLQNCVRDIPGVHVEQAEGLLADYARKNGVKVLVRGLRGACDVEPEFTGAYYNKQFFPGLETVFLAADPSLIHISSSAIKEAVRLGGDVSTLLPQQVAVALKNKFRK